MAVCVWWLMAVGGWHLAVGMWHVRPAAAGRGMRQAMSTAGHMRLRTAHMRSNGIGSPQTPSSLFCSVPLSSNPFTSLCLCDILHSHIAVRGVEPSNGQGQCVIVDLGQACSGHSRGPFNHILSHSPTRGWWWKKGHEPARTSGFSDTLLGPLSIVVQLYLLLFLFFLFSFFRCALLCNNPTPPAVKTPGAKPPGAKTLGTKNPRRFGRPGLLCPAKNPIPEPTGELVDGGKDVDRGALVVPHHLRLGVGG